jgi:thiamine biosynthesis lipoprotein ApbE
MIQLKVEKNSAKLLSIGQKVDLGAIAKGYAADRVNRYL